MIFEDFFKRYPLFTAAYNPILHTLPPNLRLKIPPLTFLFGAPFSVTCNCHVGDFCYWYATCVFIFKIPAFPAHKPYDTIEDTTSVCLPIPIFELSTIF
jgi:hypothetical protein